MAHRWWVFPDGTIVPNICGGENTLLNLGSGGNTLATDTIAGVEFQRVKLVEGNDGVNDGDVSSSNPLPVELPGTSAVDVTDEAARLLGIIFGNKTHNSAAPTTDHLAALTAVANAVAPTYIEANQVLLSVDLAGALRIVAAALPLPANAAQETGGNLATIAGVDFATQTTLAALNTKIPASPATAGGQLAAGHTVDQTGGPWQIDGDVAADGPESGNPVKIGGRAHEHGANPPETSANDDRVEWIFNRHGIPFVIGGHPNVITRRDNFTAAQTNAALVTISTGSKIVVTRISITADNANTVDVQARVGFATATTPTGAGVLISHPGIAPGSGIVEGNGSGILGVGADDEDLRITSEVPTTGSIDVVTSYYIVPT